jgi:hypothetical protein
VSKIDQPEWRLSHYVDSLLDRIMIEPCWYSAIEGGTIMINKSPQARMLESQRRKARGIKPHHLDWMVYQYPIYSQFELKYGVPKPSDGQDTTIKLLSDRDIPAACLSTVMGVYHFLRDAGFKLHGNAENIAAEIEARWRAMDEAKRGGDAKPKRVAKPRAEKASAVQAKRLAALRASGLRF